MPGYRTTYITDLGLGRIPFKKNLIGVQLINLFTVSLKELVTESNRLHGPT